MEFITHMLVHINLTRASGVLATDTKSTLNAVSAECQDDQGPPRLHYDIEQI